MVRAGAPSAKGLERRFRGPLRRQGYDAAQAGALVSVTVAAVCQHGPIDRFLEQVASNGQRLAQRNVPRNAVARALREFPLLLEEAAGGCFAPAREQLQVATILKVNEAFYQVHEAERLGLFLGIYRAGIEAKSLDDLLRRLIGILTDSLHARAGRLILLVTGPSADGWRALCTSSRRAE